MNKCDIIRTCGCTEGLMFCAECATENEITKFGNPPKSPNQGYFIANLNLSEEENLKLFEKSVTLKKHIMREQGKLNRK